MMGRRAVKCSHNQELTMTVITCLRPMKDEARPNFMVDEVDDLQTFGPY